MKVFLLIIWILAVELLAGLLNAYVYDLQEFHMGFPPIVDITVSRK